MTAANRVRENSGRLNPSASQLEHAHRKKGPFMRSLWRGGYCVSLVGPVKGRNCGRDVVAMRESGRPGIRR